MFKKLILAGVIGLSFQTASVEAQASSIAHISTKVVVSGAGGMCRDVTIITEYENRQTAYNDTKAMLLNQMKKTQRDYQTTHRAISMRTGSFDWLTGNGRNRAKLIGRVCFRRN